MTGIELLVKREEMEKASGGQLSTDKKKKRRVKRLRVVDHVK
jgi:hypothetical protein